MKNTVLNCHHNLNGGAIGEKLVVNHNGNLFVKNGEILPSDLEFLNSPLEDEQQQQQQVNNPKNNMNSMDTMETTTTTTTTTSNNSTAVLCVAELSRMFPTPPSLEAMVSSPSSSYVTEVAAAANVKSINNDKNCNEPDSDSLTINHSIHHQ
ncbi:hypothetical protein BLA29_011330, partial [Euroglyphus maynei]